MVVKFWLLVLRMSGIPKQRNLSSAFHPQNVLELYANFVLCSRNEDDARLFSWGVEEANLGIRHKKFLNSLLLVKSSLIVMIYRYVSKIAITSIICGTLSNLLLIHFEVDAICKTIFQQIEQYILWGRDFYKFIRKECHMHYYLVTLLVKKATISLLFAADFET